jgi:hypothetical protein
MVMNWKELHVFRHQTLTWMEFFPAFYSLYTNELFTCFHISYPTLFSFLLTVSSFTSCFNNGIKFC